MKVRDLNKETDFPVLTKWWEIRKVCAPFPSSLMPRGYIVEDGGVPIAAAFLYLDVDGVWAMTEWLSTNPAMAFSRGLVDAVKTLLGHMEEVARVRGCTSIISMVAPGSGEERLMQRIGYTTDNGPAHRMYGKVIVKEGT